MAGWQDAPIVGAAAGSQPAWMAAPVVGASPARDNGAGYSTPPPSDGDPNAGVPGGNGAPAQITMTVPATKGQAPQEGPSLGGATLATANGLVEGIPVVGPLLTKGSDFALAQTLGRLEGYDPADFMAKAEAARNATNEANPIANVAGQFAGAIGATGGAATVPAAAEAMGMTGAKIVPRIVNSAVTNATVSGLDAAARGGSASDQVDKALYGGAGGAIIPAAGAAIRAVAAPVAARLQPAIGALFNPEQEAARRVGSAVARDVSANPAQVATPADEAVANENNLSLLNVDRGGEVTRALARSVANQSPEARAQIQRAADDRFAAQGDRATNFVRKLFGRATDDLGYQRSIEDVARTVNRAAYNKAYGAPRAAAIWTREIQGLMQSPDFNRAIAGATRTAANDAAISGRSAVRNPFTFDAKGNAVLRKGPDGTTAIPNLEFWDIVQRNLRSASDAALRRGENLQASQVGSIRSRLLDVLDGTVPEFQQARAGAASYFGAEDALDAGRKFAGTPQMLPEAKAAYEAFSAPEKRAFAIGYSSSLIDKITAASDRTNIINRFFKTPAFRQTIDMVLGGQKAREVEAYLRVEDLADKLRGAMGNSTTARQLVELGIGAGAGYTFGGHDWKGALTGAALAKGARYIGQKADAGVMQAVAKLLLSGDAGAIAKAQKQAAKSPTLLAAVERLENLLVAPVRGALLAPQDH